MKNNSPVWEGEINLQHFRQRILHCWAGTPDQLLKGKTGCTVACASALPSETSHEIRVPDSHLRATASSRIKIGPVVSAARPSPSAPTPGTRPRSQLVARKDLPLTPQQPPNYIVRFLDGPGPVKLKLKLSSSRYATAIGDESASWCLHPRQGGVLHHGILRNVYESRVVQLAPIPSRQTDSADVSNCCNSS